MATCRGDYLGADLCLVVWQRMESASGRQDIWELLRANPHEAQEVCKRDELKPVFTAWARRKLRLPCQRGRKMPQLRPVIANLDREEANMTTTKLAETCYEACSRKTTRHIGWSQLFVSRR